MSNPMRYKMRMDKNTLLQVGEWAESRVASGEEPPWTQPKLKLLAKLMEDIVDSMNATVGIDVGEPLREPQVTAAVNLPEPAGNIIQLENFRPVKAEPDFPLPA